MPTAAKIKPDPVQELIKSMSKEALPDVFEYLKGTISDLVSIAKQKRSNLVKLTLSKPTERQLANLQNLGIDIDDKYVHTIDNFSIVHSFKQHGNAKTEASRGQIALADADFDRIPSIIENYDGIELDKNDRGQNVIIYSKTFDDGAAYYLEEVRVGRKELAMVTMYKRKGNSPANQCPKIV